MVWLWFPVAHFGARKLDQTEPSNTTQNVCIFKGYYEPVATGSNWFSCMQFLISKKPKLQLMVQSFAVQSSPVVVFLQLPQLDLQTLLTTVSYYLLNFLIINKIEHGLKFIAGGTITIKMVQNAKGKIPIFPKQINQATSKVLRAMEFNEVMWGKYCKSYVISVKGLPTS